MPKKLIRIGIVGCGRVLNAHLRGYKLLRQAGVDSFRITALTSHTSADAWRHRKRGEGPPPRNPLHTDPAAPMGAPHIYISDFQDDIEAQVFNTLEEMLSSGVVDAVQIPASVFAHHTIALAALDAGMDCLVEKPLAITVRAGTLITDKAKRKHLVLGVVEHARYEAVTRVARWLVERGYLGKVQFLSWFNLGTAMWSPDKIVAQTPWRHRKSGAGAGASVEQGVHVFNRFRQIGGEIDRVSGITRVLEKRRYTRDVSGNVIEEVECDVDDAFFAHVEFDEGAVGQVSYSLGARGERTTCPEGILIYGTQGCLKGNRLILDSGESLSAENLFESEASATAKEYLFPYNLRDPFALLELDFLRAIESRGVMEASGDEGLRDLACAYAVCESSALGRSVRIDDVLTGTVSAYQEEINRFHGLL